MIDRDKILADVAEKHRLIIDKNDPILATLTVHEAMFAEANTQFKDSMQALKGELEKITLDYTQASKDLANDIVGKAVNEAVEKFEQISSYRLESLEAQITELHETSKSLKASTLKNHALAIYLCICSLFFTFKILASLVE